MRQQITSFTRAFALLLLGLGLMIMPSHSVRADDPASPIIQPSPALLPEDVVEIQLLGLKLTKGDSSSVEMQQVWAFAHPQIKQ